MKVSVVDTDNKDARHVYFKSLFAAVVKTFVMCEMHEMLQ